METWCSQEHVQRETAKDLEHSRKRKHDAPFKETLFRRGLKDALNTVKIMSIKYNNAIDFAVVSAIYAVDQAELKDKFVRAALEAVESGNMEKLREQLGAAEDEMHRDAGRLTQYSKALRSLMVSRPFSEDDGENVKEILEKVLKRVDFWASEPDNPSSSKQ